MVKWYASDMGVGRTRAGTSELTSPEPIVGVAPREEASQLPGLDGRPDDLGDPETSASAPPIALGTWDRIRGEAWPWLIVGSMIAVQVATLVRLDPRLRAPLVLWFCLLCTGMAWARLLRLAVLPEMIIAISLSIALSGLASALFLYTGHWSPSGTMLVLQATTLAGIVLNNRLGDTD